MWTGKQAEMRSECPVTSLDALLQSDAGGHAQEHWTTTTAWGRAAAPSSNSICASHFVGPLKCKLRFCFCFFYLDDRGNVDGELIHQNRQHNHRSAKKTTKKRRNTFIYTSFFCLCAHLLDGESETLLLLITRSDMFINLHPDRL